MKDPDCKYCFGRGSIDMHGCGMKTQNGDDLGSARWDQITDCWDWDCGTVTCACVMFIKMGEKKNG